MRTSLGPGVIVLAACLMLGLAARSAQASGLYISGFGGVNYPFYQETDGSTNALEFDTETGYLAGGAVGFALDPIGIVRLRVEAEVTYRSNDVAEAAFGGGGSSSANGQQEALSGMINGVVDVPFLGLLFPGIGNLVNPYVGAGIGVARVESDIDFGTIDADGDNTSFAYQFLAGLSVPLPLGLEVFGDVRYFRVVDATVDEVRNAAATVGTDLDSEYSALSGLVGLRLLF